MCKNFAIVGIKDPGKAIRLARECAPGMSKADHDGYGIALLGASGNIEVERWLLNAHAWHVRNAGQVPHKKGLDPLYLWTGREARKPIALLAHARKATSRVTMANVHPHTDPEHTVALIHNGVVDASALDTTGSDECDSRGILNAYVAADVDKKIDALPGFMARLKGWHACVVLSALGHVDAWRYKAPLDAALIRDVGLVLATDLDAVAEVAARIKLRIEASYRLQEECFLRLDAATGEVVQAIPFKGQDREYSYAGHWQGDTYLTRNPTPVPSTKKQPELSLVGETRYEQSIGAYMTQTDKDLKADGWTEGDIEELRALEQAWKLNSKKALETGGAG